MATWTTFLNRAPHVKTCIYENLLPIFWITRSVRHKKNLFHCSLCLGVQQASHLPGCGHDIAAVVGLQDDHSFQVIVWRPTRTKEKLNVPEPWRFDTHPDSQILTSRLRHRSYSSFAFKMSTRSKGSCSKLFFAYYLPQVHLQHSSKTVS